MMGLSSGVTSAGADQWPPSADDASVTGSPGPLPSQTAYMVPDAGSMTAASRQQRISAGPPPVSGAITDSLLQAAPPLVDVRATSGMPPLAVRSRLAGCSRN